MDTAHKSLKNRANAIKGEKYEWKYCTVSFLSTLLKDENLLNCNVIFYWNDYTVFASNLLRRKFYLIKWSYLILLNISIIGWCWSITMVFIIINRKILYDGLTHLQIHIFYVFIDLFSTAKMAFSFILKCQILISPKLFSYWKKSPPNLELLITGDRVMDNFSDSNMSPVKTILLLWNQNWKLE